MYWINTDEHTECIGHRSNEQNDNKWVEADEYSRAREAANLYRRVWYERTMFYPATIRLLIRLMTDMERFVPNIWQVKVQ